MASVTRSQIQVWDRESGRHQDTGQAKAGDLVRIPGPLGKGRRAMEVVRTREGDVVTLRPCPPWCTERRHFTADIVTDATDGYHHYGPETEIPTADLKLGTGTETVVRILLKSWSCPLHAEPGPARIEPRLGTAEERTDLNVELTPAEARAIAQALLDHAANADEPR
jgi:hypothetical protein